jgi:hypothetical protein
MDMKHPFLCVLIVLIFGPLYGEPLYSPTWGFKIDLPAGYEYTDGDGINRFCFEGPQGNKFDIAVYSGTYRTMKDLIDDVNLRLKNSGDTNFFEYRDKHAALIEISFNGNTGWGLCVELEKSAMARNASLLLAIAYGNTGDTNADLYHLSALDSIIPSQAERYYPGPIIEFGYPRGEYIKMPVAGTGLEARIREHDAEAAQALVDREFALLRRYVVLDNWQEAWIRFYRAIYRDSWDRLLDMAFLLERHWHVSPADGNSDLALARKALAFVQGFEYERDLQGSDFVNLVSAASEGRGDCDSRAMLWAIILTQANIPAAMMVSREHSHAMGLADIEGQGARFEAAGTKWLVAETSAEVDIGLIAQEQSDIGAWLGVVFE